MLDDLIRIKNAKTGRCSSWNTTGHNKDMWELTPGETAVIADIEGPGKIAHIWMTQHARYREVLLKITWDNAKYPSILCPLGDFFGLGHSIVNSHQSLPFSTSTRFNNKFNEPCALNCYLQMPFNERAKIEVINESPDKHIQYFYVDYETYDKPLDEDTGYLHAEFRRANPFGGWHPDIRGPQYCIPMKEKTAWNNNYVILKTKGRGHYLGCNMSITNFDGGWWGEGDDMIWVDGYKWPPDLHGTGSEDYFNQAYGMQPNDHLRCGTSIFEYDTDGYQTSYVYHLENPVRFQEEIKVTIEQGHANHLANEVSSVAYWYADKPCRVARVPSVEQRLPVMKDHNGNWVHDEKRQTKTRQIKLNKDMKEAIALWNRDLATKKKDVEEVYGPDEN